MLTAVRVGLASDWHDALHVPLAVIERVSDAAEAIAEAAKDEADGAAGSARWGRRADGAWERRVTSLEELAGLPPRV